MDHAVNWNRPIAKKYRNSGLPNVFGTQAVSVCYDAELKCRGDAPASFRVLRDPVGPDGEFGISYFQKDIENYVKAHGFSVDCDSDGEEEFPDLFESESGSGDDGVENMFAPLPKASPPEPSSPGLPSPPQRTLPGAEIPARSPAREQIPRHGTWNAAEEGGRRASPEGIVPNPPAKRPKVTPSASVDRSVPDVAAPEIPKAPQPAPKVPRVPQGGLPKVAAPAIPKIQQEGLRKAAAGQIPKGHNVVPGPKVRPRKSIPRTAITPHGVTPCMARVIDDITGELGSDAEAIHEAYMTMYIHALEANPSRCVLKYTTKELVAEYLGTRSRDIQRAATEVSSPEKMQSNEEASRALLDVHADLVEDCPQPPACDIVPQQPAAADLRIEAAAGEAEHALGTGSDFVVREVHHKGGTQKHGTNKGGGVCLACARAGKEVKLKDHRMGSGRYNIRFCETQFPGVSYEEWVRTTYVQLAGEKAKAGANYSRQAGGRKKQPEGSVPKAPAPKLPANPKPPPRRRRPTEAAAPATRKHDDVYTKLFGDEQIGRQKFREELEKPLHPEDCGCDECEASRWYEENDAWEDEMAAGALYAVHELQDEGQWDALGNGPRPSSG